MSNYEIPYWKKYTLSIEEAASYFRIGEGKLRKMWTYVNTWTQKVELFYAA